MEAFQCNPLFVLLGHQNAMIRQRHDDSVNATLMSSHMFSDYHENINWKQAFRSEVMKRQVTHEHACLFAQQHGMQYYTCNAMDVFQVQQLFKQIVRIHTHQSSTRERLSCGVIQFIRTLFFK